MCGIAGFVTEGETRADAETTLAWMVAALRHRGPDSHGLWIDGGQPMAALGHARLAILDLSPSGHQPMFSESGRYGVVFNGEIYNFQELRGELIARGHRITGTSDTEVMLAAFEAWDVRQAVLRFNGMFAFAVWDTRERRLHLARDRFGVKPLYYGLQSRTLLFASELKALRAHPAFRGEVDRDAAALMLRYGYVPAPWSIYRGVYKLPPGCHLSFDLHAFTGALSDFSPLPAQSGGVCPVPYWAPAQAIERGRACPFAGDVHEAQEELHRLLLDATRLRMIADVPLGAFLSGGVDSSTVVALMQTISSRPVKTFAIGFHEAQYNEAHHAKAVAAHLGTAHTELYVTPQEALEVVPLLPTMADEPFADASQIPTFLVSKLARQQVTVSLSGDGGDELFGGYPRYRWGLREWEQIRGLPVGLRRLLGGTLGALPVEALDRLSTGRARVVPAALGTKLRRAAERVGATSLRELYQALMSQWPAPERLLPGIASLPVALNETPFALREAGALSQMMYWDTVSYLPDSILVKVDRASMAVSLEAREPLLDYRLYEYLRSLPEALQAPPTTEKRLLRSVLYRYVPPKLIERPKMGFGIPLGAWLRGALREWAEALIAPAALRATGIEGIAYARSIWEAHQTGRADNEYALWTLLMYQAWHFARKEPLAWPKA